MVIKVYMSGSSGNVLIKLQQGHIERILEMKGIKYESIDIMDPGYSDERTFMRTTLMLPEADDNVPLPPQIFNEKHYCGDYEAFFTAVERENLFSYLQLLAPPTEIEYQRSHQLPVKTEL